MFLTPPKYDHDDDDEDDTQYRGTAETPAPHRARVNNLTNQVSELLRNKQHLEKGHKAEISGLKNEMDQTKRDMEKYKAEAKMKERELQRCKAEGDGMREELNLYSAVQQQKAVLALAQEQMQIIELERRLVQAEAERVMRDHRIALFKAREADVLAEMAGKDARLEELEAELAAAITSAGHQRALDSKSRVALEAKVEKLEAKIQAMASSEKELRQELDALVKSEKSNENSTDKEKRQLQTALKAAKSELATKTEELGDAQEELANYKESSQEREKTLKQKLKEVTLEKDRLAGLEDELDAMKTSARMRSVSQSVQPEDHVSPKRQRTGSVKPKEKARKAPSVIEEVESDAEEPVVERSKKKVAAKPAQEKAKRAPSIIEDGESETEEPMVEQPKKKVAAKTTVPEKKAKENRPMMPRVTVRKATPIDEESENGDHCDAPAPKKKARTPARSVSPQPPIKVTKPLGESSNDNLADDDRKIEEPFKVMKPLIVKKKSKTAIVDDDDAQPEKKKKRKLLGVQPAFQWDSIMNSGDGVIPSTLSPLKPTTAKTGSIPRAGFSSSASSRGLSRFQ